MIRQKMGVDKKLKESLLDLERFLIAHPELRPMQKEIERVCAL